MAYAPQPATLAAYQTFRATKVDDVHATFGATIGTNLFLPNGKVATLADLTGSGSGSVSFNGTSDEVQEGIYNLYFTDLRAQDAVGGILVDTATIDFTYNHTTHSITADLKDLANSGVGAALVKITRDAKGRLSGTASANTDDLMEGSANLYFTKARVRSSIVPGTGINVSTDVSGNTVITLESSLAGNDLSDWSFILLTDWAGTQIDDWMVGTTAVTSFNSRNGDIVPLAGDYTTLLVSENTNLYFTAARVLAVVLSGLSVATNAAITAADTILVAMGKLQAQITSRQVIGNPVKMPAYTLTTLPSAATYQDCLVVCTNLTEGRRLVYSDGTNWLRLTNNTVAN